MAGSDQQVLFALEHEGQGKGAPELLERTRHRQFRVGAIGQLPRHPQRHGLGIGLRLGQVTVLGKVGEHLAIILDNAVMHHGHAISRMRMGVLLGRRAMRRPPCMPDADPACQRLEAELLRKVAELALGAAAGNIAILQRRHASAVIPAIFETLERIHQANSNRFAAYNADNSAHAICPSLPAGSPASWLRRLRKFPWPDLACSPDARAPGPVHRLRHPG